MSASWAPTGAFVTDPGWLQFLPRSAADWRDTTLVDTADTVDWIVITNGAKAIELRRDADEPSLAHDPPAAGPRRQLAHRHRPAAVAHRQGVAICQRRSESRPDRVTAWNPPRSMSGWGTAPIC